METKLEQLIYIPNNNNNNNKLSIVNYLVS